MEVKLIAITDKPVDLIEFAASTCYNSEPTDGKIMNACFKAGHHTPLEFCNLVWEVSGVSRALLSQITRHRHACFNVRSQRYVNESGFDYVIPPEIDKSTKARLTYIHLMDMIQRVYDDLTGMGIKAEDARYVLPNACHTKFLVTMNLREFVHVCNLRLCTRAQWEVRKLVKMMSEPVAEYEPKFAPMMVPKCESHAPYYFCTEHNCCGRHPKLKDVYKKPEKQNV